MKNDPDHATRWSALTSGRLAPSCGLTPPCRVVACDDLARDIPRSSQATTLHGSQVAFRGFRNFFLFVPCVLWFLPSVVVPADTPAEPAGWTLVWSDEFDRPGLPDPAKWSYDVGTGHNGWGNNELQYYTADRRENARVEAGVLIIEAHREKRENSDYTSARLVTKGKGDWSQGRFEIRAKLPAGRGTWPAIWMLPTKWDLGNGGWPDNGEIDIMEHVGSDPGVIHASTHSQKHQWPKKTQRTAKITVPRATTTFRTYVLEWDADEIRMYVDDRHYFTSRKEGGDWTSWPFFRDFHVVLNLAVGGNWGAAKGVDETIWPRRLEVDYVRVYRRNTP